MAAQLRQPTHRRSALRYHRQTRDQRHRRLLPRHSILGWDDVPGRPLLTTRDSPRRPESIPGYLPHHELDALMVAIENLTDPHQRAVLLVVRWTGARRDEIRRLTVDCLDAYADGHPRLRIPVGKSHAERLIPCIPKPPTPSKV